MFKDISIIQSLCLNLVEKLKQQLKLQKHDATGNLINSIEHQIISGNLETVLRFLGLFYGRFINEKRRSGGKRVPVAAIENWIRNIGMSPDANKTVRQLAFAIQTSIHQKGIPAKPYSRWAAGNSIKRTGWIDETFRENEQFIADEITRAVTQNVEIELEKFSKKYGNKKVL
jgi:hypothetical protein